MTQITGPLPTAKRQVADINTLLEINGCEHTSPKDRSLRRLDIPKISCYKCGVKMSIPSILHARNTRWQHHARCAQLAFNIAGEQYWACFVRATCQKCKTPMFFRPMYRYSCSHPDCETVYLHLAIFTRKTGSGRFCQGDCGINVVPNLDCQYCVVEKTDRSRDETGIVPVL